MRTHRFSHRPKNRTTTHTVIGAPDQIANALTRARHDGRLRTVETITELTDGRLQVIAQLSEHTRLSRRQWLARLGRSALALVMIAALAGAGWIVWLAVTSLIALITAIVVWVNLHLAQIAVCAGALVLLTILTRSNGHRCRGMHCSGCRR